MQVRVLGAHNLEDTESRHTCFLVDGVLGIDAGSLAGALTSAQQREVRALLLTHEDFDHARDVPTLGLATLDSPGAIEVFGLRETLESVREHLMDDRLYPDLTKGLNGALVLVKPTQDSEALRAAYRVTNVVSRQQEQFEFRRTVTQVALDTGDDLSAFDLRTTRVLVQAEPHELFQEQLQELTPFQGDVVKLDGEVTDLRDGRKLAITGRPMRVRLGDLGGVFQWDGGWKTAGLAGTAVKALALSAHGETYAGTGRGVFRLDEAAAGGWLAAGLATQDIQALVLSPSGEVFAGTRESGVYRSADRGQSWTPAHEGLSSVDVRALALTWGGSTLLAGTRGGLYRSSDLGTHWGPVTTGQVGLDVRALLATHSGTVLAGAHRHGVLRSTDNGATWTQANSGLRTLDVRALAMDARGRVFAGTHGGGVFYSWTVACTGDRWKPA